MMAYIDDKISAYFASFPQRTYPKGQILIFANEEPDYIYFIVSGRVKMYDVTEQGDEVIVNVFKHPAFFPMSWAINRTPNAFIYKTEEATVAHIVPADAALQFIKENPDVMFDLLSRLYRGMDGLLGRMVYLMAGSAYSRLMYELITECRRFGKKSAAGYTLALTETELAARAGLTRETVSREINKLKAKGFVKIHNRSIQITDLHALESTLGSEI